MTSYIIITSLLLLKKYTRISVKNKMAEKKRKSPAFRIELPGDDEKKLDIMDKMQKVRSDLMQKLNRPVNNYDIIAHLLDEYMLKKGQGNDETEKMPSTYVNAPKNAVNEPFFVTTKTSVMRLANIAAIHGKQCRGKLMMKTFSRKGHVAQIKLKCSSASRARHSYLWSSSPYLKNGKYLVNARINHGLVCSGILPSHYVKFCHGAGIGAISCDKRRAFFGQHKIAIQEEYDDSVQTALQEEIGAYEDLTTGIDIITDARHGWRKNAYDTSVVAIGEKSNKVIDCQHVSKNDDPVTQRHEMIGTKRIYARLQESVVSVRTHTHDRNMSVNKYVREEQPYTINQNDTWHGVKSMKKALVKVSSGPQYLKGKTWSESLHDKVEPVSTHVHWALRNCGGDANALTASLSNIVEHYKNNHQNCDPTSRCKKDKNYEPSRVVIDDSVGEKLLSGVIRNSLIFKNPRDFRFAKDTYMVESFNNVLNIYEDKRIVFGRPQYLARSQLATIHWNENVNRPYTSTTVRRDPHAPRQRKARKVLKRPTYNFMRHIWTRFTNKIYRARIRRN